MKALFTLILILLINNSFSQGTFSLEDSIVQPKQSLTTNRVVFHFDKSDIRQESFPFLDSLVTFLQKNDSVVLEVRNHRDTRGPNHYSTNMTQRRAYAVVDYLIEKGIEKNRLMAKGYGETKPLIPNAEIIKMKSKEEQEKAHQKNRRTEFVILSNGKNKK